MRYYEISLTPAGGSTATTVWSSHPNGTYDPAAPNVEFDMPVLPYDTPAGGQSITIEGVSLQQISQAQQLVGMNVTVKGGMKAGLPLANPNQAGTLVVGQLFQAWGNWEGTEMSLDMVLLPSSYTTDNKGNLLLNWTKGQTLGDALTNTFKTAYPNMPVSMNISTDLVLPNVEPGHYSTLEDLAYAVGELTQGVFNNRVYITIQAGTIVVYDNTYKPSAIQIAFTDMIGQPTWIDKATMQVKMVMRGDIKVGATIKMPSRMSNAPGLITTTSNAYPSSYKYQSAFQNTFQVIGVRHIGNYRANDASAWCTVLNCLTSAAGT